MGPRKYILKSESGARQQKGRWTLLGLCDRELELVGHDHGSENNAADWDGYDDTTSRKTRFQPICGILLPKLF